jgi:small subunit ribosomal protein S16
MLKIRLQRVGRKHEPSFRLVLTESKNSTKSGRYQEVLGWYDARRDNKNEQIKIDRVKYWLGQGVQVSDTVHNFFVENKIITGKKVNNLPKKSPIKKAEAAADTKAVPAASGATPVAAPTAPEAAATPAA